MSKTLYIVSTPIGNFDDLSFRARKVLSEVDLIAAEDTRETGQLLKHHGISTRMTSYHKFNIKQKTDLILDLLSSKDIALVSDAGTPCVSDPGQEIVEAAIKRGIKVVPIPGSSSILAALVVSGLPTDKFVFEGFLPKKPGQKKKVLERLSKEDRTIILFESPFRVEKTLNEIKNVFGGRQVVVARELTKKFEEVIRGTAEDILKRISIKKIKGEVVLLIKGI